LGSGDFDSTIHDLSSNYGYGKGSTAESNMPLSKVPPTQTRPSTTKATGGSYELQSSGRCSTYINTTSECSAAARFLRLRHTSASLDLQSSSATYDPPGCYFQDGAFVKFNLLTPGQNRVSCTEVDKCVCKTSNPDDYGIYPTIHDLPSNYGYGDGPTTESNVPTAAPTVAPTVAATVAPTVAATVAPTMAATVAPTVPATVAPTVPATVAATSCKMVKAGDVAEVDGFFCAVSDDNRLRCSADATAALSGDVAPVDGIYCN